ncbi:alpha/beta hydrolase [Streptomyces sp. NPDC058686]|uniref:alpha/beta hydrolase n=1 Tax=Streptomyces sp. NPDC058686 TaxID=3346599 RepID=UPI003649FEA9
MDYTTLKALRPSEFSDAADSYRSLSDSASASKDDLDNRVAVGMRKALKGQAAHAALGELKALSDNFHYTQTECGLISAALNGFAYDIEAAKKKLDAAVADAEAAKCTVNADGSVGYPPGGDEVDGKVPEGGTATGLTDASAQGMGRQAANFDPNPHHRVAQECADRIAEALKEATEADEKWAPKLKALKADDDLTVSDRDWADAQKDTGGVRTAADAYLDSIKGPPKEATPEDNANWWKGLTEEQRADYLALHPKEVGAMNGLPADTRDEANRIVLAEAKAKYELDLDSIPAEPANKYTTINHINGPMKVHSDEWIAWNEKYADRKKSLEGALAGMGQIQDRFDRTGVDGLPEAYLLGFDPKGEGDGRVILANGNPDTADHTAVYVPGTFAGIESIGDGKDYGDLGRSERLWAQSQKLAPGKDISTITWLDYNAPDNIAPQATNGHEAAAGGITLRDFLTGNDVAHQQETGTRAHTTAIGHSYGSTVVGDAAQAGTSWTDSKLADDIVLAGSPGVQADHAADLGVGAHHVWAMGAPWDDQVVRQGGRVVGLGNHGVIPTDDAFGGNIMQSDAGGHTNFFDSDGNKASVSLENQARVITGRYGDVSLED